MSSLILAGTALALVLYIPLCKQISTGNVKQNLATWILWSILDGIAAGTLIIQHGNFLLPAAYTLGGATTVLCILISTKKTGWTWFESFITLLVIICLIVWASSGAKTATIASSLALVLAGVPQLIESYRKPWDTPVLIYIGYTTANILSVLGGKDWSVEERFYPSSASIYCLVVSIVALRKVWIKPT